MKKQTIRQTYIVLYESFKAKANTKHFISVGDGQTDKTADSSVHATRWRSHVHHSHCMQMLQPITALSLQHAEYTPIQTKMQYLSTAELAGLMSLTRHVTGHSGDSRELTAPVMTTENKKWNNAGT